MRADAQAFVDRIDAALSLIKTALNWEVALRRLDELNARVEDPTLWDDQSAAQAVMTERRRLDESISAAREIQQERDDALEFIEMAEEEGDADLANEGAATLEKLAARADRDKVSALLSGEADGLDTYIEIHAGAGGTESQDWAEMLLRMYQRWAEARGYKISMVDYQAGDQAGIKSATIEVKGENAYGYAKTESGVHRLVRISPFDSAAKRHTSFSSVWVYP
ncbi:PCRF domain-containing protein, partial [Parasphingorhabdus sp.]|uniref:PCRF domain-containing protein n=1 Tax=Parasphingorhabdus sp. TaxID=2709688 RepID=UPI003C76B081